LQDEVEMLLATSHELTAKIEQQQPLVKVVAAILKRHMKHKYWSVDRDYEGDDVIDAGNEAAHEDDIESMRPCMSWVIGRRRDVVVD